MAHWKKQLALNVLLVSLLTVGSLAAPAAAEPPPAAQAGQASAQEDNQQTVAALPAQSPTEQAAEGEAAGMAKTIRAWLSALSGEPGFEDWNSATWSIYPLGPGTHSWVVLLHSDSREIGYLVLAADGENDYRVQEYGQGPYPLFSMNTLHRSLEQRGLIPESIPASAITRYYAAPLQGVWKIGAGSEEPLYLDAKTGGELPPLTSWLQEPAAAGSHLEGLGAVLPGQLSDSLTRDPFDPFLKPVWLKGKPLPAADFGEWKTGIKETDSALTYLGKWYGGAALYPLAVTGFHEWSQAGPYLRLEHDGSRYVPYSGAAGLGSFFANP